MSLLAVAIGSIALLNAGLVNADGDSIVGCLEVGCPVVDNVSSECKVVDDTYSMVGVAAIPSPPSNLNGISWTEGVMIKDAGANKRSFNKNFYLGIPPDKNLTGTGGCAVFFNFLNDTVVFKNNGENTTSVAQGTCQEAIGSECVNALTKRATELEFSGLGSSDACAELETAFSDNFDAACKGSSTKDGFWESITVKPLTGSDASIPISSSQNASSNCWPTLPKDNSLTLVSSSLSEGDDSAGATEDVLYSIVPILTVFFPGNGSLVSKTEAQLTCLKNIDRGVGDSKTKDDGKPSNAWMLYAPGIGALVAGLTLSTWLTMFGL